MDFSIILKEWPTYWEGLYTTIWLVAASLMLGLGKGRTVPLRVTLTARLRGFSDGFTPITQDPSGAQAMAEGGRDS